MPFTEGMERPANAGIKKGQKQYKTIQKEKARELFEQAQLKRWLNISDNLAKRAVRDQKAAEYAVNQTIGKPKETLGLEAEVTHKIISVDE